MCSLLQNAQIGMRELLIAECTLMNFILLSNLFIIKDMSSFKPNVSNNLHFSSKNLENLSRVRF